MLFGIFNDINDSKGRVKKTHTLRVRCGRRSFHLQKSRCSACAYRPAHKRDTIGSQKKTTTTDHMRYLYNVPRRFLANFKEGTKAPPRKKGVFKE
uniref:60S ribosomal protein L37 n=1 Tax=Solanum lycopersicum TaxID=4081 RepID=A0A3Q7IFT6_SOLLC